MRRLLYGPPKGFRLDLLSPVTRTTINISKEFQPFENTSNHEPFLCPICGAEIGDEKVSTALSIECEGGQGFDFMTWSHQECFDKCVQTNDPDIEM